jgi:hypothetical protein
MPTSAWSFGPINLPMAPMSIKRRVLRKQEAKQILFDFPIPTDTGPDLFELQISGLIYPSSKAFALWELTKNADEASIQITVDEATEPDFALYNGRYAVNKSEVGAEGVQQIADAGFVNTEGPVHKYDITFVQFAAQGNTGDTDVIDPESDEDGPGFDFPDGTDESFDFDDFVNVLQRIFTI